MKPRTKPISPYIEASEQALANIRDNPSPANVLIQAGIIEYCGKMLSQEAARIIEIKRKPIPLDVDGPNIERIGCVQTTTYSHCK